MDLRDYAKPIVSAFGDVDLEEHMGDMMPAIKVPRNVALSMAFVFRSLGLSGDA